MKSYEFIKECDSGATSSASIAAGPAQNLFSKPVKRVKEADSNKSPVPRMFKKEPKFQKATK
jgi:hypothetical protein